ncbi:MAG: class I SAM-dependent methyltransferase [Anaerolineae bacterium]|jgi:ubiquinone/menaquinone biosynthesis C-methylase UbiE
MKRPSRRIAFVGGLTGALLIAAWRIHRERSRERIVSHEGLDEPDVARAFNRIATMPQMRLMRWLVIRRARALQARGRAADLGSGPGYLAVELARAAPDLRVTGVDLSDEMLAEAERYTARSGLADRVRFKKGDVARIPFPDGSLDLVVSTLSLHHWRDPVGVLDEIARVLRHPEPADGRSGGSFLVFDLRRDMPAPFYLLLWFATRCIVPLALRRVNEPLGSRDAAFTAQEAVQLAAGSRLTGWRVTRGPLWLTIEGTLSAAEPHGRAGAQNMQDMKV